MNRSLLALGVAATAALLPSPALAQGQPQYRQLQLTDGRAVTAEVLSTEATGLLMRTPQGTSLISFEVLLDMAPTDVTAYRTQPVWSVHVAGPAGLRSAVLDALRDVPAVEAHPIGEAANGLSSMHTAAAVRCNDDVECIVDAFEDASWRWIVVASENDDGSVKLVSAVSTGATRQRVTAASSERDALWPALHEALMLEVPKVGEPVTAGGPSTLPGGPVSFDQQRIVALSFTPVPGLPSLKQNDPAGFAAALGIVVPTTALWVGAVGQSAQSVPETAALGAVGFYAATVLANQVTGMASSKKARRRKR